MVMKKYSRLTRFLEQELSHQMLLSDILRITLLLQWFLPLRWWYTQRIISPVKKTSWLRWYNKYNFTYVIYIVPSVSIFPDYSKIMLVLKMYIWVCILLFQRKSGIGITQNNRSMVLTAIVAKVYNAMPLNRIKSKIEKILSINQNDFLGNRSIILKTLTICW